MKNIYKIAFALLLLGVTFQARAQFEMLFVAKPENQVDIDLIDYFTLEGYNVTNVAEADFKAEGSVYSTAAGYEGFDVLFVSESIGSSSANNYAIAGFPIPCVATEGFVAKASRWGLLADDSETFFKQASSADLTADVLTMVIRDNSNWITSIYEQDDQLVWADAADATKLGVTSFDLSTDIPAAVPLADYLFDMGTLSALWAIPDGSLMRESVVLPNMVIIGLIQTDVGQSFTGAFQEFLVRCVRWVTGDYDATAVRQASESGMLSYPNPTHGTMQLRFSQGAQGSVRVNIYDVAGRLVETVNHGILPSGEQVLGVDLSGLAPATYIYEVVTGEETLRGRIIME